MARKPTYEQLERRIVQSEKAIHRGETNRALQRTKKELETIIDSVPAIIAFKDKNNQYVRINKTYSDLINLPKECIEGKSAFDITPDRELAKKYWQDDKEVIASGIPKRNIIEPLITDQTRWLQTDKVPYRDDKGNIIGVIGFGIDITSRVLAEQALKESEERYRALVESSSDAILMLNKEMKIVSFNHAFLDLFGYEKDEINGRSMRIIHPSDTSFHSFKQTAYAAVERVGTYRMESDFTNKEGAIIPIEIVISALGSSDGSIVGYAGIIRDMAEHRRAKEALRRERDFVARIMETSPACIIVVNREGQITFANPGAEEVLGLNRDKITQWSYNAPEWHIIDYDGRPLADEQLPFRQVMDTGLPVYDAHHAIEWPDGRRVLFSVNATPLFDESGHVDGVVCTIADVTGQVKTAKALRESEEKYRTILGSIEDGYYEVDTAGNFTFFNDSMCKILGYSKDELRGMNYKHYTVQEDTQEVHKAFNRVYTTGTPARSIGHGIRRKDGIKRYVQISVSLMKDAEGQRIGFRGVLRDTTERKQAEKTINEERNLLRTVIDNVPDFVYVKDTEGRYLVSNDAFARYHGATAPEEVVGKTVFDLFPEELASGFYADDQEIIQSGQPLLNREDHLVDKEGKTIWNITTKVPLRDSSGNIKGLVGIARDITHRKRSEEELKRHATQLTTLHRTGAAISSRLSLTEIFDTVLQGLSKAFGYRLIGIYLLERGVLELKAYVGYSSPPDLSLARIPLEKGVVGRTARCSQPQLITNVEEDPDFFYGSPGITSEVCAPLKRGDEVLGVLNVESDRADKSLDTSDLELLTLLSNYISIGIENARLYDAAQRELAERRRAEEALRESEERYRTLVQNLPIAVYRTTPGPKGKYLMANPAFLKMFGLDSEDELKKTAAADLYSNPEERKIFSENLLSQGSVDGVELSFRRKDGSPFWASVTARVVQDEGLRNPHFDCSIIDVTERKKAEEKIKEYSTKLAQMVEDRTRELNQALYDTEEARDRIDGILKSVADGLIVTDIYNRIILMNRAAEHLLGVRLSEVIDRPIDFAIEDKLLREQIKFTLDKKESGHQFDFELPGEDIGNHSIIRARSSAIEDKAGNQTGIVTILHDVTLEREVDRMKTEFISTAAHELRTPLTSIQGFSEILVARDDIKVEEKKKFLSYINRQSLNLASIINDLLDISRIESGRGFSLNMAPHNIADIIRDKMPYFQAQPGEHQFDLIFPEESVEVALDKEKVEQVLENILSNAVKYSPDGGRIRIRGEAMENRFQVTVEDQGIGMSPDQLEKVFDKFYRADTSNTAIRGTGLGMSIVKDIIEAHGGEVWVQSELRKGTTVTFTIPMEGERPNGGRTNGNRGSGIVDRMISN